jgi:hypothetical protein
MMSTARVALVALITIQSIRGSESNHIYVYADPHAGVSSWQSVSCDGSVVAKIKKDNFFALTLPSGRHACAIADGTPTFVVVEPNDDIFLRVDENVVVGRTENPTTLTCGPRIGSQGNAMVALHSSEEGARIQRLRC